MEIFKCQYYLSCIKPRVWLAVQRKKNKVSNKSKINCNTISFFIEKNLHRIYVRGASWSNSKPIYMKCRLVNNFYLQPFKFKVYCYPTIIHILFIDQKFRVSTSVWPIIKHFFPLLLRKYKQNVDTCLLSY